MPAPTGKTWRIARGAAALCVAACVSQLAAAEITFSTAIDAIEPRNATVIAQRLDVHSAMPPIERTIKIPGTAHVNLGDGLWELKLSSAGLWGEPVVVRDADSAVVRVWPASSVTVRAPGVSNLRLSFRSVANGPSGEIDCELHGESWTCSVPVGKSDLRFSSKGAAHEWRFDVDVPRHGYELAAPPLRFVRGASLSGVIEAARSVRGSLEGVEVRLVPAGSDDPRNQLVTQASARGFFQFKGVPAGEYTVRAQRNELVTRPRAVRILAGLAAELNAALLLDTPKRLTVAVMPPQDPSAVAWRIRLLSRDRRANRLEVVSESAVAVNGEWSHPRLIAGDYTVEVRRATGDVWMTQDVTVENEDLTLPLLILPDRISGRIALGGRPLAASLSFGGEGGATLRSDDDGQFAGAIAPARGDELVILVEAGVPTVRRTVRTPLRRTDSGELRLDLDLPATTLIGRTLKEDRSPAEGAIITVTQGKVFEQTFSHSDGTFEFAGLDPGEYRVTAAVAQTQSAPSTVKLETDQPAEVELILEEHVRIPGRMVMGSMPVIGARIHGLPRDAWAPTVPTAVTDDRGHFVLHLPPGTMSYDVVAVHPAFDVVLKRMTVAPGKILHSETRQIGGTLIVEAGSFDRVLLKHAGAACPVTWIAGEAGGTVQAGRVTIPRLDPGEYAVCAEPARKCATGYVPPHGTLMLSLN